VRGKGRNLLSGKTDAPDRWLPRLRHNLAHPSILHDGRLLAERGEQGGESVVCTYPEQCIETVLVVEPLLWGLREVSLQPNHYDFCSRIRPEMSIRG
jgi:hypothetical protein